MSKKLETTFDYLNTRRRQQKERKPLERTVLLHKHHRERQLRTNSACARFPHSHSTTVSSLVLSGSQRVGLGKSAKMEIDIFCAPHTHGPFIDKMQTRVSIQYICLFTLFKHYSILSVPKKKARLMAQVNQAIICSALSFLSFSLSSDFRMSCMM